MKDASFPVFANKFEFVIDAPLEEILPKFIAIGYNPEFNPNFTTCEFYLIGEGSSLITQFLFYGTTKFGGVFQDRDFVLLFRFFRLSEDVAVYILDQSTSIPVSKKFIRATFSLSGFYFKAISPTSTQITEVFQVDLNGSIPKCKN